MRRSHPAVLLCCACAAGWGGAGAEPAAAAATATTSATAPAATQGTAAGARPPADTAPSTVAPLTHPAPGPSVGAAAGARRATTTAGSTGRRRNSDAPIPVAPSNVAPAGRLLTPNKVLAIAAQLPKMRAVQAAHPGSYAGAYLKQPFRWQVSYFTRDGKKEIGQVIIDDTTGRVLEQWTGFQVAWTMARGYPGAFGRHVNALYIWLPLCLLFLLPFFDFRRPLNWLHLDLLMLLASRCRWRSSTTATSTRRSRSPTRRSCTCWCACWSSCGGAPSLRRGRIPPLLRRPAWLMLGVVFLLGFRVALNVTDGNVIDVGYAGLIGAQRVVHDKPLYGSYPSNNEHGDTYGPVNYEAYVPFEQAFGFSGSWDDLPAAHAAAIFFDLLAVGLLFLLGRRVRGPSLGIALAYAWVSYPFTLFALESNSNDTLVGALVLLAVLAAGWRSRIAPAARGATAALAGLTKFAPLALVPVLATHGLRSEPRRGRTLVLFAAGLVAVGALAMVPALTHDTLRTVYERTIDYQANRGSPFSVWGLYGGLGWAQIAVEAAAGALAVLVAVIPRRDDLIGLAAACAAVLIATQLGIEHWFYLYIPWFFGLVMLALLGRLGDPAPPTTAAASSPARSSLPAVAASR